MRKISLEDIDPGRIAALAERYGLARKPPRGCVTRGRTGGAGDPPAGQFVERGRTYSAPSFYRNDDDLTLIAGVTLHKLETVLGAEKPIVRVILIRLPIPVGYSGVVLNAQALPERVEPFLSGFGKVLYLPERLIDIFTGFGVAGPNYIYYFIESFTDAGVLAGLSRAQAAEVVLENLQGAIEMLRLSQKHPRQLLDINTPRLASGSWAV